MRFKGTCYICNKEGHKVDECRSRPKKKKDHPQANLTDHASSSLSAMVSEVNLTTNNKDWWEDTGATRHICSKKLLFFDYQKLEHDEQLFMGNSAVSKVEGKRKGHPEVNTWEGAHSERCTTCFRYPQELDLWINL